MGPGHTLLASPCCFAVLTDTPSPAFLVVAGVFFVGLGRFGRAEIDIESADLLALVALRKECRPQGLQCTIAPQ